LLADRVNVLEGLVQDLVHGRVPQVLQEMGLNAHWREHRERALRAVAAHARANVALVIRYYRSKEALFLAASEFDLRLPDLGTAARDELGPRLAAHFFAVWEDGPAGRQLVSLLRAAATHPDARARMQAIFETQLRAAVRTLVPSDEGPDLRATLIASQMLGFAFVRYVLE
ncbi:TetR family transcriptional regulator, partial [Raoultella sp. 18109]|uniref:TetR/AcrR family transcriptional regulator n=1 Tax=Raoultella sp. 18109 TaxID=2681441 RepID=UPI00190F53F2